jgi:formylglycine-generating enzyme
MKPYFILLLSMAVLFSFCTKNVSRVAGEVIDAKNKTPIKDAKVVVSNRPPVFTDANGEFYIEDFDLDKYIVDSITFNVRANGNYHPQIYSTIIGNKQQDIFIIEMEPVDDLEYTPQVLSLGPLVTSGIINITNKGLDSMKCIISASCPWVSFGQNNVIVPPVGGFNLNIQTITTNIQCKDSCWVYIQWGDNNKDSIQIVKDILDTQKPSANFTISNQTPNQFQSFECDASLSNDNCSTILQYRWSFDNGINWSQPSTDPKVTHSYNVQGNQTVTVEVTDEQGNKSTYSQTVLVLLAPTPPQLDPAVSLSSGGLLCINASANLLYCGQTFTGLLDHGFVWSSTIQNPDIGNAPGGGIKSLGVFNGVSGNFNATLCNLQPKTYYVRAFAKNGYDITYSNTFTITLEILDYVLVTQGTSQMNFVMGNNSAIEADVKPQHNVILAPFNISKTEITNAQYAAFLNINGVPLSQISSYLDLNNCDIEPTGGIWKAKSSKENHPVVTVSWQGAYDFCVWANGRLPTEAEWECAAKEAKSSFSSYTLYSGSNILDSYGWYNANTGALRQVMTRASNGLGIFDLSGNVREWCADWYDPNYYTPSTITDPQGPSSSPTGAKVLRGGSFALPELPARVYYRDKRTPGTKSTDIGFRCVKN